MRRILPLLGLAAVFAAVAGVSAPAQDEKEKGAGPLRRLQGEWKLSTPDGGEGTWVFEGDKVTVTMPDGNRHVATVTLDRAARPWTVDFALTEGEASGQTVKGLLERQEGKVRVIVGAPGLDRPESFDADGDGIHLFELTRKEGGDEPAKGQARGTRRRLQGEWESKLPDGGEIECVIKGDKLVAEMGERRYEITFKLDPEAKPHATIDMHVDEGPENAKGQDNPGIYKLEGDTLSICVSGNGERPGAFETVEGESYLFQFTRDKEEDEKDEAKDDKGKDDDKDPR